MEARKVGAPLPMRQDQKDVLNRLQASTKKRVLFLAPTDFGKTRVYLAYVLSLGKQVAVLTSTYDSVQDIVDEARRQRKGLNIALPTGRNKAQTFCCCKSCHKPAIEAGLKDALGPSEFHEKYPDACAYKSVKEYAKYADLTITHQKMYEASMLTTTGVLVCDEVDKALEPSSLMIAAYETSLEHLEDGDSGQDLSKAVGILERTAGYNHYPNQEQQALFEKRMKSISDFIKEKYLSKLKRQPTYWEELRLKQVPDDPSYALHSVAGLIKEAAGKFDRPTLTRYSHELEERIKRLPPPSRISRYLPGDRNFVEEVLYVMGHLDSVQVRDVQASPAHNMKGYIEVYGFAKSKLQEGIRRAAFEKVVYVTATKPLKMPPNTETVEVKTDPNADKKTVVLVNEKEVKGLLKGLGGEANILGVTSSIKRAKEAALTYGGEVLNKTIEPEEALRIMARKKGCLFWDYYGSKTSRAVNLFEAFDGVYVLDWIGRKPWSESDKVTHYAASGSDLYQIISRVLRTKDGKHRKRVVIVTDEKAWDKLKELAPEWGYFRDLSVQEIINRTEAVPRLPSLTIELKERMRYPTPGGNPQRVLERSLPPDWEWEDTTEITITASGTSWKFKAV
jgi:hypothetical protein